MTWWKLFGVLIITLAVLAVGCQGDDAPPEDGTPTETPADGTPTTATPDDASRTPINIQRTPVACVPVEAEPSTSTIALDEVLPIGKIAFVSFRDEYEGRSNREIYLISSDGTGPINLTRNSCADDEPDWSPDGTKIAWSSDRDGNFEIYVMDADGSNVTQLTTDSGLTPRWSSDGQRIAYTRGGSIIVMNADGSDREVVLEAARSPDEPCQAGGFPGGWSPDSTRILYYAAVPAAGTAASLGVVCAVTVDGSEVTALVSEPPVLNVEPVWSPDGKFVAFRSIRDGNNDVYVVNLEDGSEQRLTEFEGLDIEPEWSPDGEWIAFASNREDVTTDLYIMRADGSDVRRLTEDPAKDSYPVWSP